MNHYLKYQESAVNTATPGQVIIMLYDGAIRFTKQAKLEIIERRYDRASHYNLRAQAVVNELVASLNFDYSISNDLLKIYEYVSHLLVQGNIKKDEKLLNDAIETLDDLRNTWKQAIRSAATTSITGVQG